MGFTIAFYHTSGHTSHSKRKIRSRVTFEEFFADNRVCEKELHNVLPHMSHLLFQNLTHFCCQLIKVKGLLEKVHALLKHKILADLVSRVSTHEQEF